MRNFKDRFLRFMYGRYGVDQLYYGLMGLFWGLFVLNLYLRTYVLQALTSAVFCLMLFRTFSKNIERRRRENEVFLKIWRPVLKFTKQTINRFRERRTHVYRKCRQCKSTLRLPRKTGTHTAVCPKCGNRFEVKIR